MTKYTSPPYRATYAEMEPVAAAWAASVGIDTTGMRAVDAIECALGQEDAPAPQQRRIRGLRLTWRALRKQHGW